MTDASTAPRLPKQIGFIIGNEAGERFSYYGMRNILTQFLASSVILASVEASHRDAMAKEVFHVFVMGVYFFPVLGGLLSDVFFGKYRTIFWLSLVYSAGNALLALFPDDKAGFYAGLFLISLGSGGIKPCVSAFVGEQFDESNKKLAKVVFDAFYWIINFGSFFASLLIPLALASWGPRWAFGIPGILMGVATFVLWLGRHRYVIEPPLAADPHSFYAVCWSALTSNATGRLLFWAGIASAVASVVAGAVWEALPLVAGICLGLVNFLVLAGIGVALNFEHAKARHPAAEVDGARAVLPLLVLFALVTPFWSLFDQKASTWVLQAGAMTLPGWSWLKSPSQMQAINPLLVMLLIPFNNLVLYPLLGRFFTVTPLRKMTAGIALSGVAWLIVGAFQLHLDAKAPLSILWQVAPYAVLTLGEVLVSATGLEFAYSQAPAKMKSVLMAFWSLSVTVGNLWVLVVNGSVKSPTVTEWVTAHTGLSVTAFQMYFFALFAFVAAVGFGLASRRYTMAEHYRKA